MLASEPASAVRLHTGGGISVSVNGTTVNAQEPTGDERLAGNLGKDNAENPREWAKATITWRTGAEHQSSGGADAVQCHNISSSVDINKPSPQLVHVICVKPSGSLATEEKESMEKNVPPSSEIQDGKIRITTGPTTTFVNKSSPTYSKGKISVVVGSPMTSPNTLAVIKGEDERSSSGASSAPASDCERSDSDREPDDGTDSGFSPSRRHYSRVRVIANNYAEKVSNEINNDSKCIRAKENDVKLTISSYSAKESEKNDRVLVNGDSWNIFHMKELEPVPTDAKKDTEDVQTKIDAARAMLIGQGGTFGLKNRVQSSIVSLLVQSASNRNYSQEESGRIVVYTTSLTIIRQTAERCRAVRKILENLMIKYKEKDVHSRREYQIELKERLNLKSVVVPQVFIEGKYIGGAEVIEQLNEIGELRSLLCAYKRSSPPSVCPCCGDYKYIPCPTCLGTKKSAEYYHILPEDRVSLRCMKCDEGGLVHCPKCQTGEDW